MRAAQSPGPGEVGAAPCCGVHSALPGSSFWAGWACRSSPGPFPVTQQQWTRLRRCPFPPDLPGPVLRFYRQTYGERIPVITSAVITGRATLRPVPGGPTFPARFRFIHEAGRNYRHYIEATWFGLPVLRVNESYLGGVSRRNCPRRFLPASEIPRARRARTWECGRKRSGCRPST